MSQLVPCPSCARHVRRSASACPFCEVSLSSTVDVAPPGGRLTRAQTMGFGVAVGAVTVAWAMTLGGCPAYGGPSGPPPDANRVDSGPVDSGAAPAYGAPSP